jgi:hypothetical protein
MSNLTHTPGPWNVFYKSKYDEWHVSVPTSSGSMKWALFDDGIRSENPEADARLIAAAPTLLSTLEELLAAQLTAMPPYEAGKEAQDAWADRRAAARNNARAAIALATEGKQP